MTLFLCFRRRPRRARPTEPNPQLQLFPPEHDQAPDRAAQLVNELARRLEEEPPP